MATVAANVVAGATGDFLYAPTGTALPTSPSATPNVAFVSVGYISEDGATITQDESTNKVRAFQNADVVRIAQTEHTVTVKLTMLETNANTLPIFFKGNYVAGVGQIKGGMAPHKSWILHEVDGTNLIRTVIPDGQVTDVGDLTFKNGEPVGYPITIECFPDSSGVKAYMYFATATVSA